MLFRRLTLAALLLCLLLVPLGAWVRLNDAGLGCPDWPGCYGHALVPSADAHVAAANAAYPERPLEAHKGWKEMIHRYLAGALGLVIAALLLVGWRGRGQGLPWKLPLAMTGWVLVQALLGKYTVTWKVMPLVVTAHLFGGLILFGLLWWQWLSLQQAGRRVSSTPARLKPLAGLALLLLAAQIFLGGWTSTNYAALACPEFPACAQGALWPLKTDFAQAFTLWHPQGQYGNYEYGVLDGIARQTIHASHRLGAVLVGLALIAFGAWLHWRGGDRLWRGLGASLMAMVAVQIALGISAVHFALPLAVATAHNAGAMLLLAVVLALNYHAWRTPTRSAA